MPYDDLFYLGLKIILRNNKHEILILKMQKHGQSFWELPGGRMQFNETPEQGLRRELTEEANINSIENIQYLGVHFSEYRVPTKFDISAGLIFSFYSGTTQQSHVTLSADHSDYAWVTPTQALEILGNPYGPKLADYLHQ